MQNVDKDELINFKYSMDLIEEQLGEVMSTDLDYYSNYHFEIANEQFFVDDEDREPNTIYIVVKFSPADIDYGQTVLPFTIQAVSEENGLGAVQRLLLEYAQIYNLTTKKDTINNRIIYQTYTTPATTSNFEVVYEGFRNVLTMSGSILLSSNINRTTLRYYNGDYAKLDLEALPSNMSVRIQEEIYGKETNIDIIQVNGSSEVYVWNGSKYELSTGEELDILTFTDQYNASPDTQPYFEKKNFTCSVVKYGSYSFTISSFLIDNDLNNKVLKLLSRKINPNTNFYFEILQDNGYSMPLLEYKLISQGKTQERGLMPSIALSFTN